MSRAVLLVAALVLAGCTSGDAAEEPVQATDEAWFSGLVLTEAIVPIPGATVTVKGQDLTNITDAKGAFRLGPLEPGNYRLSIKAEGYAEVELQASPGDNDLLKVVLKAIGTNVPYHEIQHFVGYLECDAGFYVAPPGGQDLPCFGIIDLLTGQRVSWDVWNFHWDVVAPGLEGVLIEMVWEEQATSGTHMGILLRNVAGAGSGVDAGGTNIDIQYASNSGRSPLRTWVYQGVENPGADDGARFQDPQNESMTYNLMVLGRTDRSQPVSYHVYLQHRPEVFLSKFYHAMADESYTVL